MGYMRHHAMVVTSDDEALLNQAHAKATEIFPHVTAITPEEINGYRSFFIPPDGSKEGWNESVEGDRRRDQFKDYLRALYHPDKSTLAEWCEVQYADDNNEAKVVEGSDSDYEQQEDA